MFLRNINQKTLIWKAAAAACVAVIISSCHARKGDEGQQVPLTYPRTEFYQYADSALLSDRFPESDIYWQDVRVSIDIELPKGKEWSDARDAITSDSVFGGWIDGPWLADTASLGNGARKFMAVYFEDIAADNDFSSYDRKDFHTFSYKLSDWGRFMEPYGDYLCYKRLSKLIMGHTSCVDIERYYCFDMMGGKPVGMSVLTDRQAEKVTLLLRQKLAGHPLSPSDEKKDVELSDNFYISSEGVTFVYYPWQLTTVGDSCLHITIPWEEFPDYQR